MTIDEFITELAAAKVQGFILLSGNGRQMIRCNEDEHTCPISALARSFLFDPEDVNDAADNLGLERTTYNAIVVAADELDGHDPALRARLLAAVGLEEAAT